MKKIFLYPGQGAQYPGMGIDLYHHSSAVKRLFESASETSRLDVFHLLSEGSERDITQTDRSQILITLASLSARAVLEERNLRSDACAGFSLGEYSALVDAGVLSSDDVFAVVAKRGMLMEEASRAYDEKSGTAGMVAAIGKPYEEIASLLEASGIAQVYCAIVNSSTQTVIAGTADALRDATALLSDAGLRRLIPLKVSGPFHTPLMKQAGERFRSFLDTITFSDPEKPVYSNVTGEKVHSGSELKELCVQQLTSTVLWQKEEAAILRDGYAALYEVGPGTVLRGLWQAFTKTVSQEVPTLHAAGSLESIEELRHDT